MLQIGIVHKENWVVVTPAGRLDATNADTLDERLKTLVDQGHRHVVLDLTTLDFVSSAGLRVLLSASKNVRRHEGTLRLAGLHGHPLEVFEVAQLTPMFDIHETLEAAEAAATRDL